MAVSNRIEAFVVTVAAGTAVASATTTDVSFPDGDVQWIELDVPRGHNGTTGVRLLAASAQLIPFTAGAWLIADDHNFRWDMTGIIDTGSFQVQAYNTDLYQHSFYVRFGVLDFAYAAEPATVAPLPPPPVLV